MTNPIRPERFSRVYRIRWKPAKLPLPQNLLRWTDVFLSVPLSVATHDHEDRAVWFIDPLDLPFWTQGFLVANELDVLILPLTIQRLHSWTTFKETAITSTPQQPGPHIYGWTFTPVLKSETQHFLCLQRRIFRPDI